MSMKLKNNFVQIPITWKESEENGGEGMISMFELLEKRNQYMRSKAEIIRKPNCNIVFKKRVIRFYQEGTFCNKN